MAIVSPPLSLASGQQYVLQAPIRPTAGQIWHVRLDNLSQFVLTVVVAGKTAYLMPLATGTYDGLGPAEVIVTTQQAVGSISNPQLYVTWAVEPDYIPTQQILSTGPANNVPTTQTFSYTGANQTFNVPTGVTSIQVDMAGGEGGGTTVGGVAGSPAVGGKGGRVTCTLTVTPGQVLTLKVGGKGTDGGAIHRAVRGTYPDGGAAGDETAAANRSGGDGGGSSQILNGATELVVAGGGGGAGYPNNGRFQNGGDAGILPSAAVNGGGGSAPEPGGGGAASSSAGGTAGGAGNTGQAGTAGASLQGGTGGNGAATVVNNPGVGGGGGGGHFGGGGGGAASDFADDAGGGGGINYANVAVTGTVAHTNGYQSGNGYITITY